MMKRFKLLFLAVLCLGFCACDDDDDYPYDVKIVKQFPTLTVSTEFETLEPEEGVLIRTLAEAVRIFGGEIEELDGIEDINFTTHDVISVCTSGNITHIRVEAIEDNRYRVHCTQGIGSEELANRIGTVVIEKLPNQAKVDYKFYYLSN